MPTIFSHAIAAAAIGTMTVAGPSRARLWALGALCAVVPDLDVIHYHLGLPYEQMLGHRGLSHSLFFATLLACVLTGLVRRRWPASAGAPRLWTLFFLTTASHGVLDAMTTGGMAIAFFAPFSGTRYFLPWRPIAFSPVTIHEFFSEWGLRVMWSELRWIWLPSAAIVLVGLTRFGARSGARDGSTSP